MGGTGSAEAGYGVTPATANFDSVFIPPEDCWGFRILHARIRKVWSGGESPTEYYDQIWTGLSMQRLQNYDTGLLLYWSDGDSTLKLRVGSQYVALLPAVGDLPSGLVSSVLIRLQAWA